MNDLDARRIDIEQALDVALGFARNSDDRVRHFERGLLNPERKIVPAGKLLAFPWPQWFQRMNRDDQWNAIILLRQDSAEMTVPSMAMHNIGIDVRRVEIGAASDGTKSRTERLRTGKTTRVEFEADDF